MLRSSIAPLLCLTFALGLLSADLLPAADVVTARSPAANDWPQFRGPTGQGQATGQTPPVQFSETENVTWKTPIAGRGWSSPVVLAAQIWLTTATDEGRTLRAVAVHRSSGKILHDVEVFRDSTALEINAKNSHASPTPVLEPGRAYVHFGTLGTACIDTASGQVLWTNRDQQVDHKEGPGSSPILYKNLLIFHCDGMDLQYVVALDKLTGQVAWKTTRTGKIADRPDFRKAYCTPLVITVDGRDQLISPTSDRVFAYDPATGKEIWHVEYKGFSNVPRPVYGDGLLFICTGYMRPQLWAIRPTGQGDATQTHVAWKVTSQAPANPSPILVGERLYMVADQGVATCLDAKTGREIWKERLGGNFSASPVFANNHLYFSSEQGETTIIEPGDQFKKIATSTIDGKLMASLALVDNAIILRSDTALYRIEERKSAE